MLIGPGLVITRDRTNQVIPGGGVVLEGSSILEVGEFRELRARHPGALHLDAGGKAIMPGFINAHAHFYGLFARGISLKEPPPQTFRQVLERLWWRLDKALDGRGVYLSAALGAVAALRTGCTTVIDHHASQGAIDGSLDRVAEAVEWVGLRAALCYEVTDRDGPERAQAGIAENVRFARSLGAGDGGGGRLAAKFGLHASFTLEDETLAAARRAEEGLGVGFHIHCAEGPEDGAHARVAHGRKVVRRLWDQGILGSRSIVAHCVHTDEEEMGLLAESGTTVAHQPHSNMGNAVGWARLLRMRERGVRAALGTDGYTWDMIETMRTAAALHSHQTGAPGAGVAEFADVLFAGNSALASDTFGRQVGLLEPGAAADIILLDYYPPTPLTAGNLPWHVQFGLSGALVDTVLVDGRVVMRGREIPNLDEEALAREARDVALATWQRF
jgi:putative selenium metabolism protein SsnA